MRCLTSFHNRCMRTILGVTRYQQWTERLTSKTLSGRFGMGLSILDIITDRRRLQWLGHVGRMSAERLPKMLLFGELRKKRPCHGTKKRWRDLVSHDLQAIGMERRWYQWCQDRQQWRTCREGVETIATRRATNTCAANTRPKTHMLFVIVEDHLDDLVISPDIRNSVHKNLVSCPGFPRARLSQKSFCGRVQGSRCCMWWVGRWWRCGIVVVSLAQDLISQSSSPTQTIFRLVFICLLPVHPAVIGDLAFAGVQIQGLFL